MTFTIIIIYFKQMFCHSTNNTKYLIYVYIIIYYNYDHVQIGRQETNWIVLWAQLIK